MVGLSCVTIAILLKTPHSVRGGKHFVREVLNLLQPGLI